MKTRSEPPGFGARLRVFPPLQPAVQSVSVCVNVELSLAKFPVFVPPGNCSLQPTAVLTGSSRLSDNWASARPMCKGESAATAGVGVASTSPTQTEC